MSSFDPQDYGFGFGDPPPRPTTPPVRKGFLVILLVLSLAALVVYGVPYIANKTGHAWEAGRARAAAEALAKLDKAGALQTSAIFRLAVTSVSPAVVNVQSQRARRNGEGLPGLPVGGGPMGTGFQDTELGSGVVIDRTKGYVVTNYHVVKDADRVVVRLGKGSEMTAHLVGADAKTDLAVVQVRGGLPAQAEWGDSEQLEIGDWVLAIGSPLGFDHSVTAGIVSATERNELHIADYESFIQTDAAINPGNSGGPLINISGKVVGINTAIISRSGGYEGIGLAIPSSLAKRVVEGLIKDGRVIRGYLGLGLDHSLNDEDARRLRLPDAQGALVGRVQPGSPAAAIGLRRGDVIVKMDHRKLNGPQDLRLMTAGLDVGKKVALEVFRDGEPQSMMVTIGELPEIPETAYLGFHVKQVPSEDRGTPAIEVDTVEKGGPAFQSGLRPGMRILGVGRISVSTLDDFKLAAGNYISERGLPLFIRSQDGRPIFLPITVEDPNIAGPASEKSPE